MASEASGPGVLSEDRSKTAFLTSPDGGHLARISLSALEQCLGLPEASALDLKVNYGNFMHGLIKENIQLNRKVLTELSMHEPYSFKAIVDVSRSIFPGNKVPKKEGLSAAL